MNGFEIFKPFVDGYYDVENQYLNYIYKMAEKYFRMDDKEKNSLKNIDSVRKLVLRKRKLFLKSIGGLPSFNEPMKAKIKDKIYRNNYRIEKILYESLPKFYVTALLYVPENFDKPMPAILFLCGHARDAKAYDLYQRVCIDLVNNGFIVLAIDPIGQGERLQYWDPINKREIVRWGTYEHSYAGLQCTLTGSNIARYFIYDAMRGVDYLYTRREVDVNRIGVTGSSGGGTQTSYLMMIDDRISVAVPCNYITSREAYIKTNQAHDAEQNIFGAISNRLNYDDFLIAFAPKPLLIGASAYDFFCIEGTLKSYFRAKNVYRLFNAEDKISIFIGRHTHHYSSQLREAAVNWFKIHLKGEEGDFKTKDIDIWNPNMLNVTKSGQILEDYPRAKTIFDLNLKYFRKHRFKRRRIPIDMLNRYKMDIRQLLKKLFNIDDYRGKIYPRIIKDFKYGNYICEKIFFFSEPDIILTSIMIKSGENPTILFVFENGTEDILNRMDLIESFLEKGYNAFILDVRGIGGVKTRKINPAGLYDIYGTEFKLTYDSYMLSTSTLAMRVYDVIRGIDYLFMREDVKDIGIYGNGRGAIYSFFASAMDDRISEMFFENMLYSYIDVIETKIYDRNIVDERIVFHGLLRFFDIIDLIPLIYDRKYKFINLRDSQGKIVDEDKVKEKWVNIAEKYYPYINPIQYENYHLT
ncbi:MAG: hypothetical protein DRJ45_01065 [Thermoprotei archaeon]|nr:MAG: hypothetical protein DRJ45_01065 [Thermoprotei archaeon]